MRAHFDRIGKELLGDVLSPLGTFESDKEVALADAQRADVVFVPRPGVRTRGLGFVDWIAREPVIVELFSRAPSVSVVRTCVRKQLSHQVMKRSPEPARLWVVCAGRPTGAIDQFSLRRRAFWPRGTYEGPPGMRLSLVVVTELPRTRATLLLRLLGRGAALVRALEDLEALPGDAPEVLLAEGALDLIRRTVLTGRDRLGLDSAKAKELVMSRRLGEKILEQGRKQGIETGLRQGIEKGIEKGRQQGRLEALRDALLAAAAARFGRTPARWRKTINGTTHVPTLTRWVGLVASATKEDIDAELANAER